MVLAWWWNLWFVWMAEVGPSCSAVVLLWLDFCSVKDRSCSFVDDFHTFSIHQIMVCSDIRGHDPAQP